MSWNRANRQGDVEIFRTNSIYFIKIPTENIFFISKKRARKDSQIRANAGHQLHCIKANRENLLPVNYEIVDCGELVVKQPDRMLRGHCLHGASEEKNLMLIKCPCMRDFAVIPLGYETFERCDIGAFNFDRCIRKIPLLIIKGVRNLKYGPVISRIPAST